MSDWASTAVSRTAPPVPRTTPPVPRTAPTLAKLARDHGWYVRPVKVTFGRWGEGHHERDAHVAVIKMYHPELLIAAWAMWVTDSKDSFKWHAAAISTNPPPHYFTRVGDFKAWLEETP